MPEGISVVTADGFATIEFLDSGKDRRGEVVAKLIEAGGTANIKIDTGGSRRSYIVPEAVAEKAGLLADTQTAPPVPPPARPVKSARTSKVKTG